MKQRCQSLAELPELEDASKDQLKKQSEGDLFAEESLLLYDLCLLVETPRLEALYTAYFSGEDFSCVNNLEVKIWDVFKKLESQGKPINRLFTDMLYIRNRLQALGINATTVMPDPTRKLATNFIDAHAVNFVPTEYKSIFQALASRR